MELFLWDIFNRKKKKVTNKVLGVPTHLVVETRKNICGKGIQVVSSIFFKLKLLHKETLYKIKTFNSFNTILGNRINSKIR